MNKLLKISFNKTIFSAVPIISWLLLGLIIDKNLVNIFSLTYPVQFVYLFLLSLFGTAPNINEKRDKDNGASLSGILLGTIAGGIIFGLLSFHIKDYINFMNMDYDIYKEFALYSILSLYIQLVFGIIIEKLYFNDREKEASLYMVIFNLISFMTLIGLSLITKNRIVIIGLSLVAMFLYTTYIFFKVFKNRKICIHFLKWIKYESTNLANNLFSFIIFLFGLSNAFHYGAEYTNALNLVAIITDTQWDAFEAVMTLAKVEISKGIFNYKKSLRNAYKLVGLLLCSSFLMFGILVNIYDINYGLVLVYFSFEFFNFLIAPIYDLNICFLQLNYSAIKTTSNKVIADILRLLLSLTPTPFCTGIGQVVESSYQFIASNYAFHKNFKVGKNG